MIDLSTNTALHTTFFHINKLVKIAGHSKNDGVGLALFVPSWHYKSDSWKLITNHQIQSHYFSNLEINHQSPNTITTQT